MSDWSLSILIVNWNTRALLQQCLTSLANLELSPEVIVVDNASSDDSAVMVQEEFPGVRLIPSNKNLGFAAGNNLAAAQAHGQYLLLLNPDTVVPVGALGSLVEFADEHPTCAAVGPELRNRDGSLQRSCWRGEPNLKMALADALYLWKIAPLGVLLGSEYRAEELKNARTVGHLLGACMMIRRQAWQMVGGLDEGYFLFLEETDWCARARRAGWEIFFVPGVYVTHFGQESMRLAPSKNLPQYYRSYLRFYRAQQGASAHVRLLKTIIGMGCYLRIGMWLLREKQARSETTRRLARNMVSGYRQTLREMSSF